MLLPQASDNTSAMLPSAGTIVLVCGRGLGPKNSAGWQVPGIKDLWDAPPRGGVMAGVAQGAIS